MVKTPFSFILRKTRENVKEASTAAGQKLADEKRRCPKASPFDFIKLSVVDLLDIADVDIVQHIAALGQDAGESTQSVQHDRNSFRYFSINLNDAILQAICE